MRVSVALRDVFNDGVEACSLVYRVREQSDEGDVMLWLRHTGVCMLSKIFDRTLNSLDLLQNRNCWKSCRFLIGPTSWPTADERGSLC